MGQDAKAVIAGAQKALGDPTSITYSGSAKDVAFQQCGANAAAMVCHGTHDPMRPITSYVRVIDLAAPASRHTGGTTNIGPGGSTTVAPGTFFQQVTPQQADLSQPWAASLELYLTPWGFLKGAAENNATVNRRRVDGRSYTVLTWSPAVKAPSGKNYVINGYLGDDNLVERVETWVGDNIMGDMHVLATYTGWKDFGGVMAPSRIVQTRGGWPFFAVDVTAAQANPADLATLAPAPAGRGGGPGGGGGAGRWRSRRSGWRPAGATGADRDVREARRWCLPAHHRRGQLRLARRGLPRPHHDARGGAESGAGAGLHRGSEDAHTEQADPVRDEHACARRSHRRITGHGGRRRHHHHAEEQRDVLHPGAEHAANAPERPAGDQSQEGEDRCGVGEEGLFGWHGDGSSSTTSTPPHTRTG